MESCPIYYYKSKREREREREREKKKKEKERKKAGPTQGRRAGHGRGCERVCGSYHFRLCHGMWLFHLHSTLKLQLFYPVFPLAESTAKTFCWLSLWNFKKSINHFL